MNYALNETVVDEVKLIFIQNMIIYMFPMWSMHIGLKVLRLQLHL